jgi:phage terminase large subunit GpA-like protein
LITKVVKGYRKTEWRKMRERNEALETRIHARAARFTLWNRPRFKNSTGRRSKNRWT